ncbi:hypothetical protein [Acutalibacter sp. 1XD8-36]|uniref:hypothetical protein n=1 Tax=Acutalibacter sp. 1XD8-36 TaxID=2320852 RepID=UPI0013729504|nr:hypothetical protein [Acutalibacter sp. 1XD8-36]
MRFIQIKTGTILETENKETIALMQKSDAYQVVPDEPVKVPEPPAEPTAEPPAEPPKEPPKTPPKNKEK